MPRPIWLAACWAALLPVCGCNSKTVEDFVSKTKETVVGIKDEAGKQVEKLQQQGAKAQTALQESAGLAGNFSLTIDGLDRPYAGSAYYQLIPAAGSRPSVLQIRSYSTSGDESYPSMFLQAAVRAQSADDLRNQTVDAVFFLQAEADGIIWDSAAAPLKLQIEQTEDGKLTASVSGQLRSSDGQSKQATGSLQAVSD